MDGFAAEGPRGDELLGVGAAGQAVTWAFAG